MKNLLTHLTDALRLHEHSCQPAIKPNPVETAVGIFHLSKRILAQRSARPFYHLHLISSVCVLCVCNEAKSIHCQGFLVNFRLLIEWLVYFQLLRPLPINIRRGKYHAYDLLTCRMNAG